MAPLNIVFCLSDDHASKAISAYGAGINQTPNIDRLAKEGMLFNHCYVNNSICTPSRATILTGMHSHVNLVRTLAEQLDNRLPNVAKQLRSHGGYQTAMVGKWHLGEGKAHQPTGFDYWSVVPDQGEYWDPHFLECPDGATKQTDGYVTDVITDKCLDWLKGRNKEKPFFLMCHHKAPHRSWECDDKHRDLYKDPIRLPETFSDDYRHRSKAAKLATMRVAEDLTYFDLGLVQPEGGRNIGDQMTDAYAVADRKIPSPADVTKMRPLMDKETGETFTFHNAEELAQFKYQRFMQRYLRTIQSIDDNVGRLLNYLDADPELAKNTLVIYTSDQGFFLGDHGWFDKRFMYEDSFQMPFLARLPSHIKPGTVCDDIVSNVDFAPLFLDYASVAKPSYMQGTSFRSLLEGKTPEDWQQIAYHRYWMNWEPTHHTLAHYGCRDQRYKLIYWYNEPLDAGGARDGPADYQEWELFDCEEDPLELFNVYESAKYGKVREKMTALLEKKMMEIGDEMLHPRGEKHVKGESWVGKFWAGGRRTA